MTQLLEELDSLIKKKRPELFESLSSGVSSQDLQVLFGEKCPRLPDTLKEIWYWHNGQSQGYYGNFHANTNEMLMSSEDAKEVMDEFNEYVESGDMPPDNWRGDWLPFAENGGGNYMCVSLNSGEIFYYDKYVTATGLKFPSIENWLVDVIDGYRAL